VELTFTYLVTVKAYCEQILCADWCLRINTKDGKSILVEGDKSVRWWEAPTEEDAVDCAVLSYTPPDEANADVSVIR